MGAIEFLEARVSWGKIKGIWENQRVEYGIAFQELNKVKVLNKD